MRDLAKLLYKPFKTYVSNYSSLESKVLAQEMTALKDEASKDLVDELRNIGGSVAKAVAVFEQASKRCCDLTEACAYPGLIQDSFSTCIAPYVERFTILMKRLDRRKAASHSWLILQQSLTLNQICGDLMLQLEDLDGNLSHEFLDRTKSFLLHSSDKAIHHHDLYLLDNPSAKKLKSFHDSVNQGIEFPISSGLLKIATKLCKEIQASTFGILFHPVVDHLSVINQPLTIENIWKSPYAGSDSRQADMPVFSFVPQEYITQIGQYLMTLPQHLEPYMTLDNPALTRSLQERVFPYCGGATTSKDGEDSNQETPADFLLSCVARATCQVYQDNILKIPEVTPNSAKQLHVDIGIVIEASTWFD